MDFLRLTVNPFQVQYEWQQGKIPIQTGNTEVIK